MGLVLFRLKEYLPNGAFSLEEGERGFQSEIGDRISDNVGVKVFLFVCFYVMYIVCLTAHCSFQHLWHVCSLMKSNF